ncbi:MAG: diguanylate cyclase [Eubacterium sp.]|nr:diguanylate cyclase [Eubacterium sp.]
MKKIKNFFLSISTKLMLLIVLGMIVLSISLVVISVLLSGKILTKGAVTQMNLFCEERADDINTELLRIEDAVGSLSRWTRSKLPDVNTISEDEELRDAIVKDADDLIRFMTADNEFIQGAYIHYALDITGVTGRDEGVYYTRSENGEFVIVPFTQMEIEQDPVAEFWYYGPIKNKAPLWTKPYFDGSVEDYIISYIQPIFIDDTPVAIIGIDVNFRKLLQWVDSMRYRETGYMYLKEADGSAHYHIADLEKPEGVHLHDDNEDDILDNADLVNAEETGNKLIRYIYKGRDRVMAFVTLRNGMKFVLCDDYDSIYKEKNRATVLMISVSVGLTIVLAIVASIMASRITNPLRKLTYAAHEISGGDYDVVLPPEKNNEVGALSKAFRLAIDKIRAREEDNKARAVAQDQRIEKAAERLKKQNRDIIALKNLAYADSLTKAKNKNAYDDTVGYINEQIKHGTAEFAVIMCDLNYLKLINDNYGHQAGDQALKRAADIICTAFPMSSVFRIGGDEFVVIPSGIEYARLDEHLENMRLMLEEEKASSDELEKRISISFGSAVFERKTDKAYRDVFARADKLMYDEKQRIHASDGYDSMKR